MAVSLFRYNFSAFSNNNVEYSISHFTSTPNPELQGHLYNDVSMEGWLLFAVATTDKSPKMVYGTNYDGTGGIWFSLT